MVGLSGCQQHEFTEGESRLIEAKALAPYLNQDGVVIIDMRSEEDYAAGHVLNAVNLPVDDILISVPVEGSITSTKKFTKAMKKIGVSNDSLIIAYDRNKMAAARFLWTAFMYGHENVLVVDGGLNAIQAAGIEMTTDIPEITEGTFESGEPSQNWMAKMEDVQAQVNMPDPNVILLDVRSQEEYYTNGKIPTSVMIDYKTNFYSDGTFKNVQATRINYLEEKIYPENDIIIYCQTSMRAAPVFLELYEAGYRNIRIYDGAFLEWSSNTANPVEMPEGAAAPSKKDAS